MSKKFELVKRYYNSGLWNEQMVRNAVGRWITSDEAEAILSGESEDGGEVKGEYWECPVDEGD